MNSNEYTKDKENDVVAAGVLSFDEKLSDEERREIVFEKLEAEGYDLENKDTLEVRYEEVDDDTTNYEVIRINKNMSPSKDDDAEELYSNTFVLDPETMDSNEQKRVIFTMMQDAGIKIDPTAEYEVTYEATENYDEDKKVVFTVYKHNKVKAETVDNTSEKLMNASDDIFYEEESVIEEIFSGSFILDGLRMSEEEQRDKVMKMMKDAGVEVEDDAKIDIGYEGAEDFEDGMSTRFVVIKEIKKVVPYKIISEKIYSGEYILDGLSLSAAEQREKVFDTMEKDGIDVGDKSELDIRYEGAENFDDAMGTMFSVYRMKKVRVDEKGNLLDDGNNALETSVEDALQAPEIVNVEEVHMEEIVNGTLDLENMNSSEDIDNKIFEMLKISGVEAENMGEIKVSYGEKTTDNKLPFAVSKVIKENVKYEVDKKLIGTGIKKTKEDVFAAVQRNQGLDIRFDPNYEIVYDNELENGKEYTLLKTNRKKISSSIIKNDEKEEDVIALADKLYDEAKKEVDASMASRGSEVHAELDKLKKSLETIDVITKDKGLVDEVTNMLNSIEEKSNVQLVELDELDVRIRDIRKELKSAEKDYEESFNRMRELAAEEVEHFEKSDLMSDEEILAAKEKYNQDKLILNEMAIEKSQEIEHARRKLTVLMRRKNRLEKSLATNDDKTDKVAIEEKKELTSKKSLLDNIDALYSNDSNAVLMNKARDLKLNDDLLKAIETSSTALPEKIVSTSDINKDYVPGTAPADMVEVHETKDKNTVLDRISIYVNPDDEKTKYVRKNVAKRFNLPLTEQVKIKNSAFYRISNDDVEFIVGNANNDYSPYEINYENVDSKDIVTQNEHKKSRRERQKNNRKLKNKNKDTIVNEAMNSNASSNITDKITIYVDLDNNKNYANKPVFNRFNLEMKGNSTRIDNTACFELEDEDKDFIVGNANNDYSPYVVEYVEVHLGKKQDNDNNNGKNTGKKENDISKTLPKAAGDTKEDKFKHEKGSKPKEVTINFYRDLNDDNQVYVSLDTLKMFEIIPNTKGREIENEDCYRISSDTEKMINYVANNSVNPKYIINYKNVRLKKEVRSHVETILDKITTGLEIRAKDAKKFNAVNFKASKNFKNELKSGNYLYNIVHFLPAVAKMGIGSLKKLGAKLTTTERIKKNMTELNRRLDEDLSEEELDVLFEEYKGSQLKTDMNNQINDAILKRLKRHGLEKVVVLNEKIKYDYTNIFALLGEIEVIDKSLVDEGLEKDEEQALINERVELVDKAAVFVKDILVCRKDANNLLSGGVHGLEEDFKAVATKLSYVGMRFAKTNDFDNELQHKLGEFGENLNNALSEGDNEAILTNFMGLESCYYENTEVAKSALGRRSIGNKYYSPLAEQFDYRDDPFVRDLLTTVVFASAATSVVNASLVHQFKSQELLNKQNTEAANINSANDGIMDYVHETGAEIEGKRDVFRNGMEAQAHEDVLSSANMIERANLDMSNWSFTNSYHAGDALGHSFFNSFNQDVTSKINEITANYGSGAINQVEAVHQMAKVANDAQSTLVNVSKECSSIIKDYAESHPQFDVSAIQDSIDYVVANPGAISEMNQAMLDVTNLAGGLEGLTANHVVALSSLPSDMSSTLVCAASAAGLAYQVSKTMAASYGKKGTYGSEVTEMMDDYLNGEEEDLEEENTKSR